ncbi:PQQ-dependent dehydrogenase, methanol/ethanol family [Streptomyces yaanensis]|uniref:PQQ-dependent dehydrogenase, methanol/ethanol family n=1 Tax=Streptomyces yaanensis TaxID=1142239 RepID=A0ABV7SCH2_9ACTN|nr:PQQ-dependent dehydrogenase, methanol/ethanol family [Streptomyces sp. CGMCC 4.7035]WNB98669.1 PQQ-dependent dehydrogenase, methanol/ethanol family [Streptomyces sp. CGMCC 4.7035]
MEYIQAPPAVDFADLSTMVGSAPPVAQNVSYERILQARSEPQNWLTYYGAYDGQRYSPLDQINVENVERLTPAWVFQFGSSGFHAGQSTYAFEAAPIVVDGVMYLSGWDGWVWAVEAATGRQLWQYKHAIPFDVSLCCGNVNRGVAVAHGKVFVVTLNAHVVALDATTGHLVWDATNGDVRAAESATVAPLIVKDKVIVGSSGGEFGVRGHLDAYYLETGKRAWRTYTVPKPGEPGSETWPDGPAWARGGGNTWVTGTYDPELNLLYWGTGNPAPDFDGAVREGDNLYTDSVIAVDADSGEIRWHYQCTPHDVWDYDSNMECILYDLDGQKLLAHFDKNGYLFTLNRANGERVRVTPFGERITWGEIDVGGNVTPKVFPQKEGEPVHFWPGPAGAKEWTHAAYSPRTELFYVPVQDVGSEVTLRHREFKESIPYWGASVTVDAQDMQGFVKAISASTGEEVWRWRNETPMSASVLATGGDLVFAGKPSGEFNAFNAHTGQLLWQFQTGSGHHSSPTTYSVDGRQYIAVPVGWGSWVEGIVPAMLGASHGDAVFAFALPQ